MLNEFVGFILYNLLKLNPEIQINQMLHFFIYDSIKILLLLFGMVAIIGTLRTYISREKIKKWLIKRKNISANLVASIFGALTPFCSCSSIPLFFGFIDAGVPLGVTFSFLITSPLVNEYLVVIMLGFFGWKITGLYVVFGILVGVLAGKILGRMNLENQLTRHFRKKTNTTKQLKFKTFKDRVIYGLDEAYLMVKSLWIWVLVGVGIGALIHNYVPKEIIESVITQGRYFTVPLATLLGVPIYGSCIAVVPIASALFEKGLSLGTALSFMMAASALSLPQAVILKKAMKWKLLAMFFGIVIVGIILIGYIFNLVQLFII